MRRGNVKGVVSRLKPGRALRSAVLAQAPAVAADLEAFLRADSATTDRTVGATPASPAQPEDSPEAPPEPRARGPPWKGPPRGTDRSTQKN